MALKYLVLLLVIVLAFWWLGRRRAGGGRAGAPGPGATRSGSDAERRAAGQPARTMVACAHCGVLLPRGEALPAGEVFYCGPPHRSLGPRSRDGE